MDIKLNRHIAYLPIYLAFLHHVSVVLLSAQTLLYTNFYQIFCPKGGFIQDCHDRHTLMIFGYVSLLFKNIDCHEHFSQNPCKIHETMV